jgi:hydrogenase large subunit
MSRVTIDPVTRIEGHLRIDLEVDGGAVRRAWSSGTMWRGIELILNGRDPREAWVFTQRICGVCTTVHAIASVRAVENALGMAIPLNAQLIRNLIVAAHALHDHVVHFYHLAALDWVDVTSALKADPAAAAKLAERLSEWPRNSRQALAATKERLAGFVASGRLGIFQNGYWGHAAMKLPPEVNLLAVHHYLQALEYQRAALKVVAVLGSKTPNVQNLAVGGVANAIDLDSPSALNMEKLFHVKTLLEETGAFVRQVLFPDVAAVGALYAGWAAYGAGVTSYLSVPDLPLDGAATRFALPGGTIMDADLARYEPITGFGDARFRDAVTESVAHAWYDGDGRGRNPFSGETRPAPGPWEEARKYSWVKSPRWNGRPMQVGPLAQVLAGLASGHEPTVRWATRFLDLAGSIAGAKLGPAVLHSTLGRIAARCIRTAVLSDLALDQWKLLAENIGKGDVAVHEEPRFPAGEIRGFGYHEAPRGTLSHWVVIRDGKIASYQAVVPSTWNAGPRDEHDQPGPYEAALVGNPIADPSRPLEALRTVHSFDPCLACAIHVTDVDGQELSRVKVL